jgi:hypothetical protein
MRLGPYLKRPQSAQNHPPQWQPLFPQSALMLTPQCLLLPEFGTIGVPVIRLGCGMTSIKSITEIDTIRIMRS